MAVVSLLLAGLPAAAEPAHYCQPWPEVPTSFCTTYDGLLASALPSAPLDLTLAMVNDSPAVASDQGVWLESAEIAPLSVGTTGPRITPSSQLPNGLIVLGGGSCSEPVFADCAGHGTVRFLVTDAGPFNGYHLGHFGISRAMNVNPPAEGLDGQYTADIRFCFDEYTSLCSSAQGSLQILAGQNTGGGPALVVPTRYEYAFSYSFYTAHADASLETMSLHLTGDADTVAGAEPGQSYRVFSTPNRCGAATSMGAFHPRRGGWVSMTRYFTVTGCPTPRFTAHPDGFAAALNGTASEANLEGRTVAKWIWSFGDGATKVTTTPLVRHKYTQFGNHTVTLVVEDSEGARSTSLAKIVKGTTMDVAVDKSAERVRAYGPVNPDHPGDGVTVTLLRHRDGRFRKVDSNTPTLNSASRYSTAFDRPKDGRCRMKASYLGDADHLGSTAVANFAC
jgi:PKD repeat protein